MQKIEVQLMAAAVESRFAAPAEAEWHREISEAAYYLAEKRQFAPGHALDDWLEAEEVAKTFLQVDSRREADA